MWRPLQYNVAFTQIHKAKKKAWAQYLNIRALSGVDTVQRQNNTTVHRDEPSRQVRCQISLNTQTKNRRKGIKEQAAGVCSQGLDTVRRPQNDFIWAFIWAEERWGELREKKRRQLAELDAVWQEKGRLDYQNRKEGRGFGGLWNKRQIPQSPSGPKKETQGGE